MRVQVFVTIKSGVPDPKGETKKGALHSLGYPNVSALRIGKYITFDLATEDPTAAEAQVREICAQLLVNAVYEQCTFEIDDAPPVPA